MDFTSDLEVGVKNAFVEFYTKEKMRRKRAIATENQKVVKFGAKGDRSFTEIFKSLGGSLVFKSIMSNESSYVELSGKTEFDIPAFDMNMESEGDFHVTSDPEKFQMDILLKDKDTFIFGSDLEYKNEIFHLTTKVQVYENMPEEEKFELIIDVPDKSGRIFRNGAVYAKVSSASDYERDFSALFAYDFFVNGKDSDNFYELTVRLSDKILDLISCSTNTAWLM